MSDRHALSALTRVSAIRRLREDAARLRLGAQQMAAARARQVRDETQREHEAREAGWMSGLASGVIDADDLQRRRLHAGEARVRLEAGEAALVAELSAVSLSEAEWADQLRLVEAADRMTADARRALHRRTEERRMSIIEDLLHARRRRP